MQQQHSISYHNNKEQMNNDFKMYLDTADWMKVQAQLASLGDIEKQGVIGKGLQEAAKIVAEQTKINIAQRTTKRKGNLISSVTTQTKKTKGFAYVGFKRPAGASAHLLEFGTKIRQTKKGANRGKVEAKHFEQDAVETKRNEAMNILQDSIRQSINKIMNR